MTPDDVYRQTLQGTIEGLRYWVPSVADVAHVAEGGGEEFWHLQVAPKTPGGCPFELLLRHNQYYDIVLAGESYEYLAVEQLGIFLPLVEAVVEGHMVQRQWFSRQTGALMHRQSRIVLADGAIWQEGGQPPAGCERRDQHFLPYRR